MNLRGGIDDCCWVNVHQVISKLFTAEVAENADKNYNGLANTDLSARSTISSVKALPGPYSASAVSEFADPASAAFGTNWHVTIASAALFAST